MPPVQLPSWRGQADDACRTLRDVDAWAGSPSMTALVAAFGGSVGALRGAPLIRFLDEFAADVWDFRAGRERNLAPAATLTAAQAALVLDSAVDLGFAGQEAPSADHYDTVLLTGGMVRAGLVKPRFMADLLAAGLSVSHVVFLGAHRPFGGDEAGIARALGVEGEDETDAMLHGLERAFGPLGEPTSRAASDDGGEAAGNASWLDLHWADGSPTIGVIAAPSSAPELRRAHTRDTYEHWAAGRGAGVGSSTLVVTTAVYVPYQAAGAVEVLGLGYGFEVETIGVSAAANDLGGLTQVFGPQEHLQELRSAIRGMRSLRDRLAAPPGIRT
ncbi:MAG: hypothetical protein H7146_06830 [Burkholderiaceae bacterium]|nr:hypothetical protein [Microbacteriaceae bacterium]